MLKTTKKFLYLPNKAHLLLDFIGIIIIWRGVWGLLDIYIFPENQTLSYITSILLGFILLIIDGKISDDLK